MEQNKTKDKNALFDLVLISVHRTIWNEIQRTYSLLYTRVFTRRNGGKIKLT